MKPAATYPTPYGVSVAIFDDPKNPGEYLFDMEATAICCGIYKPQERARFAADATAAGRIDMSRSGEYGGLKFQRLPIPRPKEPAYPNIPHGTENNIPIENWVDLILEQHRWCDRADAFLSIISSNLNAAKGWEPLASIGLQILLTATLEHLPEKEIDCLEAAAFYALTVHPEWSAPAIEWLRPMSDTWFKDWTTSRPNYRRFSAACRKDTKLPNWISGDRV